MKSYQSRIVYHKIIHFVIYFSVTYLTTTSMPPMRSILIPVFSSFSKPVRKTYLVLIETLLFHSENGLEKIISVKKIKLTIEIQTACDLDCVVVLVECHNKLHWISTRVKSSPKLEDFQKHCKFYVNATLHS